MTAIDPKLPRRIVIYREGQSLTVAPKQRDAENEDSIVFLNATGEELTVSIPDPELFGTARTFDLPAHGSAGPFPIEAAASGGYPYAAYSKNTREFAHASVPIIIIYPR